ncbi:hypothetical protein SAMN05192534_14215 [Alteribacillus persepolensis]|uniref:Uncharacterized protein n=1 Tax=Alteribacillus persepolensis TaxID=568899 RepID=A0A1G8K6W3_9BACI|nr:hypothetical protein [Alteribacillus persepolensis]SDI39178.1 hypothetical protein SAMN05192534_14215 [Alteribacillus persepolensis]
MATLEELYNQVQHYLNMDEEIDFKEFKGYYQDVITYFDQHAAEFDEASIWKGLFIVESIMSNAENRTAATKRPSESKKYKKMASRTKVYAQHFTKRLHDIGYTHDEISEEFEKMLAEGEKEQVE